MTSVPSNNMLTHIEENVKETTENEKLWDAQACTEAPTGAPELVLLPSGRILTSAPWIVDSGGSVVGLVLSGPIIVETVFNPATRTARFAVQEPGKEPYYAQGLKSPRGPVFRPLVDSMVYNGVVLLPSEIGPPVPAAELLTQVMDFLHRYVAFGSFEDLLMASLYVLYDWRFDEFTTVPYLRFHGPAGSGKRRCLKTIASIAYRAMNIPGGRSHKAMLRLLNKFRGTAIIYYADIAGRSQKAREAAIQLALGSQVDLADIALKQCDRFSDDSWEPMARSLFGPKVLATSQSPLHPLLDSICLTIDLRPTKRTDIPVSLPFFPEWHEAIDLRNKLLKYRLDYARGYPDHQSPTFERGVPPHLQELAMPLKKVAEGFPQALLIIDKFIGRHDLPQLASTRLCDEIIVLNAIAIRLGREGERIAMKRLAEELTEDGTEPMTPSRLGKILSNLGVSRKRSTGGLTVVNTNPEEIIAAYRGLGEEPPPLLLAQSGDLKDK